MFIADCLQQFNINLPDKVVTLHQFSLAASSPLVALKEIYKQLLYAGHFSACIVVVTYAVV